MDTKLTIRLPRKLLANAKQYAHAHHTTLTRLVTAYLESLPPELEALDDAPIVSRLTGSLWQDVTIEDYRQNMDIKYASPNTRQGK